MDLDLEREVRQLLNGDNEDRAEALKTVDQSLRHLVCSCIAMQYPGMSIDDLADCWSETLCGIWRASQRGAIHIELDKPLESLARIIMHSRAVDHFKRRKKYADIVHEIGRNLRGTSVGKTWGSLDPAERRELKEIIRDEISRLPPRQKMVLQTFANYFPISTKDLAKEVSRLAGTEVTEKAVERALAEGRAKLREVLGRTAYAREFE